MWEHVLKKNVINFDEGELILVHKPLDWTSFDVVARLRSMYGIKKIGHAGTLDPKATGLLILCTGRLTKAISEFQHLEKEYEGIIELGSVTKSFDSETEVIETKPIINITSEKIEHVFQSFVGEYKQIPPMYSAVKKNGRRLYKYARKGKEVQREARLVTIKEFALLSYNEPYVRFRVVCSKGTYIRSLAHEVGQKLGCGAYLKELIRTRIGNFTLSEAIKVDEFHLLSEKQQVVHV